jgi:hypothetical protein
MPALGRNNPCYCGEDKKYRHYCLSLDAAMPPAPDAHRSRTPENSNRPAVTSWLATEANRAFDPLPARRVCKCSRQMMECSHGQVHDFEEPQSAFSFG